MLGVGRMSSTVTTAVPPRLASGDVALGPRANSIPSGFEIVAPAGSGTFCDIWQARDRKSGELCALKVLRTEWQEHRAARKLLENEAEIGLRVTSPHVVRVVEGHLKVPPRCLVLEWLTGHSLEAELVECHHLSCNDAVWIARQCAQGLLDLHLAGFSHGDIKPSNVFLQFDGAVKLIDLGFSRPLRVAANDRTIDDRGCLTGTPEYMAPESLSPALRDGVAKDIYGFGVTLYRMLAGRLPFHGTEVGEILQQQQRSLPPSLRSIAPHVPREIADFTERLLSKQPFRRASGLAGLVRELVLFEIGTLRESAD